jgi:hypothetical protein
MGSDISRVSSDGILKKKKKLFINTFLFLDHSTTLCGRYQIFQEQRIDGM